MNYLGGYTAELQARVQGLLEQGELGVWLLARYPDAHGLRTDRALYGYIQQLKTEFLRGAEVLEPAELRKEVRRQVKEMREMYRGKEKEGEKKAMRI